MEKGSFYLFASKISNKPKGLEMKTSDSLIVGISGASGFHYALQLLKTVRKLGIKTHVVVTKNAQLVRKCETDISLTDIKNLSTWYYHHDDFTASIASGGILTRGMIIIPCSTRSLANIAHSMPLNLLTRAAEVTLKEKRRLILMLRDSPYTLAHIKNMELITLMGGVIYPPMPNFYIKPASTDSIIKNTVDRMLSMFDIEVPDKVIWQGIEKRELSPY